MVEYDDGGSDLIWAECAGDRADEAVEHPDPWVVMLLPAAVTTGESIETALPVDGTLLSNLASLQRVWATWYPELSPVAVDAPAANRFAPQADTTRGSASFFSGGVDSFHVLAKGTGPHRSLELGGLITVWGFDIPLSKPDEFDRVRQACEEVAGELGLEANIVATNMRESRFARAPWGALSHGCALSSIGLLFSAAYREILIGSTHRIPDFQPWGSSLLTDPLCSSSTCRINHFGATESRVEKTRALLSFPPAHEHLRVCWRDQGATNCGKCSKCTRTMATLDLLGHLDRFRTFDARDFSPSRLAATRLKNETDASFVREIAEEAAALGAPEIASAASTALVRYRRERRIGRVVGPVLRRLGPTAEHLPYFWRFAE